MSFSNKFCIPSFGMKSKKPQLQLLQRENSAYGGELLKKDKNRERGRPIVTNHTMHLVMRSTKAVGDWSFKKPRNERKIKEIIKKFSQKYGVRILSLANKQPREQQNKKMAFLGLPSIHAGGRKF